MASTGWTEKVFLQLRPGMGFVSVANTRAAFNLLTTRWPVTSGKAFWAAQEICLAALDGRVSHEHARQAFISAAMEAKITTG
ncbi:DUF982 domain-containing protein [Rhizobium sp. SIMBA_035]